MRYTSKRGKRGGKRGSFEGAKLKDIHCRIEGLPAGHNAGHSHNINNNKSSTILAEQAAPLFECSFSEETEETHLIPRQSVTRKQLLGIVPQTLELAPIPTKQLNKRSYDGKAKTVAEAIAQAGVIETTENRLAWKSDRTLLKRNNPFTDPEAGQRDGYKREGKVSVGLDSRSYRDSIPNADPEPVKVIGVALDDADHEFEALTLTDEEINEALSK